jgi:plastocyanin
VKRQRRDRRVGIALFMIPIVAIGLVVAYQFLTFNLNSTGTIIVTAQTGGKFAASSPLKVPVVVAGRVEMTPLNLTLPQGEYSVGFGRISWYNSPANRTITVAGGKTAYAVGVYVPIVKGVEINAEGFNVTSLTAYHGVTPVTWINHNSTYAVLQITGLDNVIIAAGENFTYVFPGAGQYGYQLFSTQSKGIVNVS